MERVGIRVEDLEYCVSVLKEGAEHVGGILGARPA